MNPSDQVIDHIIDLLRKIEEKLEYITKLVNAALSAIPAVFGYIVDKVRDGWNAMLGKLAEFWDWFADKLSYAGNPFMLNGAAAAWTAMGGKVARINDTITDLSLSVDDRWTGMAADQYAQSVEPQRRANTSIMSDFAQNIASAMGGLAGAIIAFWAGVALAIVTLLGALAGAAVATGTIVGLPAAPVLIGLGIAAFLIAAGGGVAILYVAAGNSRATLNSTSAGILEWPKIATQ
jgi:phage-related protein